MLHTKVSGNRFIGSFFTIYECGSHLGHVTSIILIIIPLAKRSFRGGVYCFQTVRHSVIPSTV